MNDVLYKIDLLSGTDLSDWNRIDDVFENYLDVVRAINYFISNLKSDHSVPGNDYYQLLGIADWAKQNQTITQKQSRYTALTLALYWNQIDLFKEFI